MLEENKNVIVVFEIKDNDYLYRRIHPKNWKGRLSSAAFKSGNPPLSVDLARLTNPEEILSKYPEYGLAKISVRFIRELGLSVKHDPIEGNFAHSLIIGKITNSIARKIARTAEIISEPK
ncbi:MAG: hypothetical protein ACTSRP_27085 [Candidatus Helarchaeota archaeon]